MEYMTKELKKQTIANKKWEEKNKEYSSYLKSRSSARSFIKNKATLEDLEQLEEFIKNRREELISRTLEIDEELYNKLEFLSGERYDASISKLINLSVEELIKTENINVYKRKNNSYVSRSVLLRKSVFDGLYELKNKFRIPIYLLVNIAIRNVLIEEKLL